MSQADRRTCPFWVSGLPKIFEKGPTVDRLPHLPHLLPQPRVLGLLAARRLQHRLHLVATQLHLLLKLAHLRDKGAERRQKQCAISNYEMSCSQQTQATAEQTRHFSKAERKLCN